MVHIVDMNRVSVFIDHSNVFHYLCDLKKSDPLWEKWYDPTKLVDKLIGTRELVKINFYCSPPPSYLLQEGNDGKNKYWKQTTYYEAVKKLPRVELKYARLIGVKGDMHEKNLDTQLTTDLLVQAQLNEFDTAIIIANDQDYVSPVEAIKQMGRRIELVYFKYHLSMNLKKSCDLARRTRRVFFEKLPFTFTKFK